ncbi:hypothetical protein PG984_004059 [Apiospora sp. TS-2023a]
METLDDQALEFIKLLYLDEDSWKCRLCLELQTGNGLKGLDCGHDYCVQCLKGWVTRVLKSESLHPISCCNTPIPSNRITDLISTDLEEQLQQKKLEYDTPAAARIYCCKNSCSAFIDRSRITEKRAQCPACETETCVDCRCQAHDGYCGGDEEGDRVLSMAREQGWHSAIPADPSKTFRIPVATPLEGFVPVFRSMADKDQILLAPLRGSTTIISVRCVRETAPDLLIPLEPSSELPLLTKHRDKTRDVSNTHVGL